jgi:aspartyl protease family protein
MSDGDTPRLVMLVLMIMLLLSSFLVQMRGRGAEVWKAARAWAAIIGVLVLGVVFWPEMRMVGERILGAFDPARAQQHGAQIRFEKADDGHFWARARVNSQEILFMVDTGASGVVLTMADAQKLGFSDLTFSGSASTANGIVRIAPVRLDRLELGDVVLTDIPAAVNGGALDVSLLGMEALSRFGAIRIEGNAMILAH